MYTFDQYVWLEITNIEYRIKSSTVTRTLFLLFKLTICITNFVRKKSTFYRTFKICRMYTFDQYVWLEITNA